MFSKPKPASPSGVDPYEVRIARREDAELLTTFHLGVLWRGRGLELEVLPQAERRAHPEPFSQPCSATGPLQTLTTCFQGGC